MACVGPRLRARGSAQPGGFTRSGWLRFVQAVRPDGDQAIECEFLIASGSLIPLAAWDAVGGMEEALFIDQVDIEWCQRAIARGYGIFGAEQAVLEHKIGRPSSGYGSGAGFP